LVRKLVEEKSKVSHREEGEYISYILKTTEVHGNITQKLVWTDASRGGRGGKGNVHTLCVKRGH